MLDIAKDFNQMAVAQSKVSNMPDSTDQDGIDEDNREREQEDRLKKIEDFLFTTSSTDKTLQDLLCRIIDGVDWCKCSK